MNENRMELRKLEREPKTKVSNYCFNRTDILINDNMGGKMKGIPCISTISVCNPICLARMQDEESICHDCYVQQQLYKKGLVDNCIQNYEILANRPITEDEIPKFMPNAPFARFESFGDVGTVQHAKNYITIANGNPNLTFTMWTKNAALWDKAIEEMGKPGNLICVLSSDKENEITEEYKKYWWVDHVFTVFTLEYVREHNIRINCGGRSCMRCQNCYIIGGGEFFVNELLKKDQKKATDEELGNDDIFLEYK